MVRARGCVAIAGMVALACGQTSQEPRSVPLPTPSGAGNGGAAATGGHAALPTGGAGAASASAAGGSSSGAGMAGTRAGGGATTAGSGGDVGVGGIGSSAEPNDPNAVKPTPGCGHAVTQATGEFVMYTLPTAGEKAPNCADRLVNGGLVCGPWTLERTYFLWLPPGYDKDKAYPIVFQGPGCGGEGTSVYSLSPTNDEVGVGVDGSVIRVGLRPPPNSIGHGTVPNQGCFDDREGDDSVDMVFYETLVDKLRGELCFDQNRIYVSGNSSGSWLANELACKYAGNEQGYAIRAVATNTGGLPIEPQYSPTCTDAALAGVWVYEVDDSIGPIPNKYAIKRAMHVNGCPSSDYDEAFLSKQFEPFPIGGGNPDDTCKRLTGCRDAGPLVVCALPGVGHGSHDAVANAAFATLFKALAAKP